MSIALPNAVVELIQQDLLRTDMFEALRPAQLFRALAATRETWEANSGDHQIFTRRGLLPIKTKKRTPGVDPSPQATPSVEQWAVTCNPYNDTIDTNLGNSFVEIQNNVLIDAKALAVQAGQSINHIARNCLFNAYLGGNTRITATATSATQSVAYLAGFNEVLNANGRAVPVSPANPLTVTIGGTTRYVVGVTPADATEPNGPGTITLSASIAATAGDAVLAGNRSIIQRVGGGSTSEAIATGNKLTLSAIRSCVAVMRSLNVPTFDGFYRMHLDPTSEDQLMADTEFRQYFQGVPDSMEYREFAIGRAMGVDFYRDNEVPGQYNTSADDFVACDTVVQAGGNAGVTIHRPIIYGKGCIMEKYVDLSKLLEAGFSGAAKVGDFTMAPGNTSAEMDMDGIKYILRAPQDRLQETMAQTWSYKGDFGVPSDSVTGTPAMFKRAMVIEHAG